MFQSIDIKHTEPQIPHRTSKSLHGLYQQLQNLHTKRGFLIWLRLQKHDGPHLLPCSAAYESQA